MDFNQLVETLVTHVQIFLIVVGIFFLFVAFVNIKIKPIEIQMPDKLTKLRLSFGGIGGVFFIIGLVLFLFPSFPPSAPQAPPASISTVHTGVTSTATIAPTSSAHDDFASSLIPIGQQPVINDPLKDNSQGYTWDIQSDANGSCNFAQGHYLLAASAGLDNGIGCQAEAPQGTFSNFVYQIQMTILSGVNNDQSGAGLTFRTNTAGTGQQYQVLFDAKGDWQVSTDVKDLNGGICTNPCPHFHTGFNQPNVITVRAAGNFIQIQINGYDLSSYTDSTYSSGAIGVQMNPGTENSSVAFANVRVWQL
jgi:hypothetical protein